jgi:hypothetical protein
MSRNSFLPPVIPGRVVPHYSGFHHNNNGFRDETMSSSLCNVCGVGNVYRCQLAGEVLRICAGCANVHSQPNPDGPLAGWKRHGVKLTTNKQIEEVNQKLYLVFVVVLIQQQGEISVRKKLF